MAKKRKDELEKKESPTKALLTRVRERYKVLVENHTEVNNRRLGLEDMRFVNVPGEQWDANMKKERGDRPCYEFNKLRITCKRIINDMRANRPSGKVRGTEDSDKKTAEVYEGLIRNIWNLSDGDTVIDYAGEYQVSAGMGSWRITTKYVADDVFDQDIVIETIQNPFSLFCDPAAKDPMKRDAQDWILTDKISKHAYESRWPNKEIVSWEESEFDDDDEWEDEETVRIVEYWYKEPYTKELWQLQDGKVIDAASDEAKLVNPALIKRKRVAQCQRVKMCIASGDAILEKADWAGPDFPFVMVYGEHMVIDGKVHWHGLARFAKDAQRSYNVSRTAMTETVAQAPQAKWWATVDQALGHTDKWAEAHQKCFPYLLYNADPKVPGPPARMGGADVPAALVQLSMLDSEDIKAVTGIFDPSLGREPQGKSGRALIESRQQGEIATFNYQDNMARGIRRTWEILVRLIPEIYDTERELRILGMDGAEDYVKVNEVVQDPKSGQAIKVNDLAQGRYDVTITVGPSFGTKRQEAAEIYGELAARDPNMMGVAGDLVFKAMDLPYSDEIAERYRAILPPPIQQLLSEGKDVPPEAQAVMAQAAQAMQMVEQKNQLVMQAAQELQQEKSGLEKGKAEIQTLVAQLETKKAQFDAHVAKEIANLTQAQAQLQVGDANLKASTAQADAKFREDNDVNERQQLGEQVAQAVAAIQELAQQFMQHAVATMAQIQQQKIEARPRIKAMEAKREGGKLVAVPIYEESAAAL